MKSRRFSLVAMLALLSLFAGCGGGGGGSSSGGSGTGTVSMSITDAKPVLPDNVKNCFVTIDEVLVHKSDGGWKSLPLPSSPDPYTIDLMEFTDGNTTELVPPAALESGKYTQVRLSVVSANLRFENNPTEPVEITIPSENLKTDKNFEFTVGGAAVDITIDFDLSKSLVVEGPPGSESYKLKPVLHIVETEEAATIEGTIAEGSVSKEKFIDDYVVITVFVQSDSEEYTRVKVVLDKDFSGKRIATPYSIFWLVPDQAYWLEIDYDPVTKTNPGNDKTSATVSAAALGPGDTVIVDFP